MEIKQYDIWLANLNPSKGTEAGKTRPVVIVQTDLLNTIHLSTLICPVTTNVQPELEYLRIHLAKGQLDEISDVLVDQIRAIDNTRLISKLGRLTQAQQVKIKDNLRIMLDL
ncbi:type II toxin-antitoxin system PemK/MazF family toxin [Aquirufa sp. OSTEICH-129V]|uniref:mRNA interferase n=1 Tax=Aquirufa avitistagni TaxID=3104728 RepID=A0ABW6D820_9BACT